MHSLSTYLPRFLTQTQPCPELMREVSRTTRELIEDTPTEARISELTQFYRRQVRSYWDENNLSPDQRKSVEKFQFALTARRFKLPLWYLQKNPLLKHFLESNCFHKRLSYFKHQLKFENGEMQLFFENNWTKWSVIQKKLESKEILMNKFGLMLNAEYSYRGLCVDRPAQPIDSRLSDEEVEKVIENSFIVFEKKENPDKTWKAYICTESIKEHARCRGDHSYIRVLTPNGNLITIGAWRDEFSLQRHFMLARSPEPSAFYHYFGDEILTEKPVDRKKCIRMLNKVMRDHENYIRVIRNQTLLPPFEEGNGTTKPLGQKSPPIYCTYDYNCNDYTLDLLEMLGLPIKLEEVTLTAFEFFLPKVHRFLSPYPMLLTLINTLFSVTMNTFLYLRFQATRTLDKLVHSHFPQTEPLFTTFATAVQKPVKNASAYHIRKIQDQEPR